MLAGLGGLIGLAIAQLGVRALVQAAPIDLPRLDEVHVDAGILQAAIVIVAVTAVVVGLLPPVIVGMGPWGSQFAALSTRRNTRKRPIISASRYDFQSVRKAGSSL